MMKYMMSMLIFIFFFLGCAHKTRDELKPISYGEYKAVSYAQLPSWDSENFDEALDVFIKTCKKSHLKTIFTNVCAKAQGVENAKEFFENSFTPFAALSSTSLATGYYEPSLEGSYTQSSSYPYPLYGVPDDLVKIELINEYKEAIRHPIRGRLVKGKIVPYYSREEIMTNALTNQNPICYVKDKIDLFFLQVQGSGRIILDDNSSLYIGYADQNGFPYHSIGKEMIKRGCISKEEVSLQSIYTYLQTHPNEIDSIFYSNPSYIFFQKKFKPASGALGVTLEEGRSVAVDRKNIPLGMPLFISTNEPLSNDKYERIVFAHDTGTAIKGEARIDIFFGSNQKAKKQAGLMQAPLKLWMLVPNDYLFQSK